MQIYTLLYVGLVILECKTTAYPYSGDVVSHMVTTMDKTKNDEGKGSGVYLNVTVYQQITDLDSVNNGNYTFTVDIIPVDSEKLAAVKDFEYNDLQDVRQLDSGIVASTPPPGGLLGSIESFMKVIPAFPGAAVETVGNLAVFLPELLGINVTQIFTSTVQGIRTQPVKTAITAFNNVAFCNPIIAGINYGRCRGFFMAN